MVQQNMNLSTSFYNELSETGLTILDDFLTADDLNAIHSDIAQWREMKAFRRAGVGKGGKYRLADKIRRDEILWFDPQALTQAQKIIWDQMMLLKESVNRHLFLGLRSFEGHYAIYQPGGFYEKHVDAFSGDSDRQVSTVLYLNRQWKTGDGGELRVFQKDIEPIPGRLVCFLSDQIEHQVLPTKTERFSFAGWFKKS